MKRGLFLHSPLHSYVYTSLSLLRKKSGRKHSPIPGLRCPYCKMIMLKLSALLILLAPVYTLQAQIQFSCSAKKVDALTYELRVVATLDGPWHIYSQRSPEGGPDPTRIRFSRNPILKLQGAVQEEGKLVKRYEEVFDMQVLYFEGKVSWVQRVQLLRNVKTHLQGTIHYMLCNEAQCLPPTDYAFTVAIE